MATNRLEILKGMLAQDAGNAFARYGLATEYVNSGAFEQALEEFKTVLAQDPSYVAAYYHGGQTLERLGRLDDARALYERGLEACTRKGDSHTYSEIERALSALPV
jgi:Tfp pilus assembly protein PilF